jgi:hypothetical protein
VQAWHRGRGTLQNGASAHYASADIFRFSTTETFGNVTMEAMDSGLAAVAYDYAAARCYYLCGRPDCSMTASASSSMPLARDLPRARMLAS